MSIKKILITFVLVTLFVTLSAQKVRAANITKTSNKQVVIDNITEADVQVGSRYTVTKNGSTLGLIEIAKLNKQKTKAIGNILQGKAAVGATLTPSDSAASGTTTSTRTRGGAIGPKTQTWGVIGGFNMNTMDVTFTNPSETVNLKGTSYNLLAFYEYPVFNWIGIRFWAGMETFNGTGKSSNSICDSSTSCKIAITYLSLGGVAKWTYMTKPYRLWVGANYEYLVPMAKSSTVLSESKISNNYAIGISTGADFPLSPSTFIPIHLEYGVLSSSADVKATQILVRAGYGMRF